MEDVYKRQSLSIAENENSAATDNTPDLGVMNEHGMYAKVSENYVVLPNNADFSSCLLYTSRCV